METYLGPSAEPIPMTLELQRAWMDDNVQVIPPLVPEYDHEEVVYGGEPGEFEAVATRMQQLEDLMDLRNPLPWHEHMIMGMCPCGVTNEQWWAFIEYQDACDDPMGDYHGRNV